MSVCLSDDKTQWLVLVGAREAIVVPLIVPPIGSVGGILGSLICIHPCVCLGLRQERECLRSSMYHLTLVDGEEHIISPSSSVAAACLSLREDVSNVMCTVIDRSINGESFVAVDVVVSFLCQLRVGLDWMVLSQLTLVQSVHVKNTPVYLSIYLSILCGDDICF